jgi:Flp pilus assembly protein TadD
MPTRYPEMPEQSRQGGSLPASHTKRRRRAGLVARWAILVPITLASCTALAFGAPDDAADKAQQHADRGFELAQTGNLRGAEAELRVAIRLAPDDEDYLAGLGSVLGMQQKLEEASEYFEKALRINPGSLTIRRNLATDQWQLGRLQEARANLERILRAKPGDPPTVLLLGMVAENLKDYAKAARLLETVPDLVKQRPESIAALGRSYYQIGQKQKAKEMLEGLLGQPMEPGGIFLASEIAVAEGDSETALKLLGSIRSSYPDQPRLLHKIALAQYRGGHFAESENILLDLINSGHPSSDVYNLLAWSYYKQDKFQETVRAIGQAIDLEPANESNYLDLGQMFVDHGQLAKAQEVARQALERIPSSFRCHMMKGLIEAKQGAFTDAVATYGRAVALNSDSPEATSNLARMQWLAGMNHEAEVTFEQGIKRFPQDALTHQEYALMLLKRAEDGDAPAEARAVSLLKQASAVNKSLAEPHYQLGNLWLTKGRIPDALEELLTAASLNPAEAKTHFALARAYRRQGRSEQEAAELAIFDKLKAQAKKPE